MSSQVRRPAVKTHSLMIRSASMGLIMSGTVIPQLTNTALDSSTVSVGHHSSLHVPSTVHVSSRSFLPFQPATRIHLAEELLQPVMTVNSRCSWTQFASPGASNAQQICSLLGVVRASDGHPWHKRDIVSFGGDLFWWHGSHNLQPRCA